MISVLTVSKRHGWEQQANNSLSKQTYQNFEWVVVSEARYSDSALQLLNGYPVYHHYAPPKTRHSNLNASLNEGLRNCNGDFVVFYQDFIDLPEDCVEKLYATASQDFSFVTTATINPDGNHDARYTGMDGVRKIEPPEWEANVAIAPMKALKELGGFDEEYDDGWSWDNVNVAERADMLGYKFYIDESIKPRLHFHIKEPDADPTLELNYLLHEQKMRNIQIGKEPLKLNYLK